MEQLLMERERLAEEVLVNKQLLVDYDRKRNGQREALNQWRQGQGMHTANKAWMQLGDMFIRLPADKAKQWIEKDQGVLNEAIETTRNTMHASATALQVLEGSQKIAGFDLKSLNQN
ncbi:hypothetical protein BDF14DRAFT_645184 [Spinellus fusiger]|nr:hypothetical protein BDF14DRAFT_645184 [Spinellus fusiger]